jgi:filamentous hemagglutinin family protein
VLVASFVAASAARADVVRDGRVGSAGPGAVASETDGAGGLRYLIGEADGQRAGNNLFHSFSRMDLTSNETAVYQGPAGIRNLITTITGGRSAIDGKIQSEIDGANLFLINPDGIVFGENATVDLKGALTVSTADRLIFSNGEQVETGGTAPPGVLSVADPVGFGFLGTPAPISIVGSRIELQRDRSLSLIGGDITLSGQRTDDNGAVVSVPRGRLDLVALAGRGDVFIDPQGVRVDGVSRFGDVEIVDDFVVSTSGLPITSPFAARTSPLVPGSGPIFVKADDLTIRDAQVRTMTVTSEDASDIDIELTGALTIAGGTRPETSGILADTGLDLRPAAGQVVHHTEITTSPGTGTVIETDVCIDGSLCGVRYRSYGNAGDVKISARDVLLLNGGKIRATSAFEGNAGNIEIDFRDEMVVAGRRGPNDVSLITTNADSPIPNFPSGNPGSIAIRSEAGKLRIDDYGALVIQNGSYSAADGLPGRIEVDVAELEMSGNARIDSSTRGAGPGGTLDITARDRITLRGRTDDETFTGISTLSQPGSTGDAGEIRVTTANLVMTDGAEISARPADATSQGAAGNLRFDIGDLLVMRDATISTESPNAAGGNIDLGVSGVVDLLRSQVTTSVTSGPEAGGNITLRPGPKALVLGNSQIIARADAGAGGRIDIEAGVVVTDPNSAIDASSARGIDGVVLINGVEGNIVPEVAELATPTADASRLLREPCAARRPGASNRFVVDERRFVSVAADDYLAAPISLRRESTAAVDRRPALDLADRANAVATDGLEGSGGADRPPSDCTL